MPLYVTGWVCTARLPCCSTNVRLAISVHHELCGHKLRSTTVLETETPTDIKIEGYTDDGDEPQDLIEPPDVAAQPVRVVVHEWLEQIERVNGRQRERVEEE